MRNTSDYIKFNKKKMTLPKLGSSSKKLIAPCKDCGKVSDHLSKGYCRKCYAKHKPKKGNIFDFI